MVENLGCPTPTTGAVRCAEVCNTLMALSNITGTSEQLRKLPRKSTAWNLILLVKVARESTLLYLCLIADLHCSSIPVYALLLLSVHITEFVLTALLPSRKH